MTAFTFVAATASMYSKNRLFARFAPRPAAKSTLTALTTPDTMTWVPHHEALNRAVRPVHGGVFTYNIAGHTCVHQILCQLTLHCPWDAARILMGKFNLLDSG